MLGDAGSETTLVGERLLRGWPLLPPATGGLLLRSAGGSCCGVGTAMSDNVEDSMAPSPIDTSQSVSACEPTRVATQTVSGSDSGKGMEGRAAIVRGGAIEGRPWKEAC